MKIVFLNPSSKLGGAERCLIDMVASLRHAEPSIELGLIVPEDGPLVDEVRRCGATVTVLPIPERILQFGDSSLVLKKGRKRGQEPFVRSTRRAVPAKGS